MIQYEVPQTPECCFVAGRLPILHHFCHIDGVNGNYPRAMHQHSDCAEIIYIYKGRGAHVIGNTAYDTSAGDVLIFNEGITHDERAAEGFDMNYYCLGITGLRIRGLPENAVISEQIQPVIHLSGEDGARLRSLCALMHDEVRRDRVLTGDVCRFMMVSALLGVLEGIREKGVLRTLPCETVANRAKRFVDAHYCENLTLDGLSEQLGLSPFYLTRLFKKETGQPPLQYIMNRRIGEAQSLLIATEESISVIAERVGYDNANYFNALFKRNIGMTPGRYRKTVCRVAKDSAICTE